MQAASPPTMRTWSLRLAPTRWWPAPPFSAPRWVSALASGVAHASPKQFVADLRLALSNGHKFCRGIALFLCHPGFGVPVFTSSLRSGCRRTTRLPSRVSRRARRSSCSTHKRRSDRCARGDVERSRLVCVPWRTASIAVWCVGLCHYFNSQQNWLVCDSC